MDHWKVLFVYDPEVWVGDDKLTRTLPDIWTFGDFLAGGRTPEWTSWTSGQSRLPW